MVLCIFNIIVRMSCMICDHPRDRGEQLRHEHVDLFEVFEDVTHLVGKLVNTVECIEYGSHREADGNIVAVLFPVEVAADGPPEILEIRNVLPQLIDDTGEFLRYNNRVMGSVVERLASRHTCASSRLIIFAISSACLSMSFMPRFHVMHVLLLSRVLHADQKRYRRVFDRCSLGPGYALHPGNPWTRKTLFASLLSTRKSAGLRISWSDSIIRTSGIIRD